MQLWGGPGAAMAKTTILGFGSLLSEQSSRLTFPDLENFRLVRVPNYRRLMQHPASIFFQSFCIFHFLFKELLREDSHLISQCIQR